MWNNEVWFKANLKILLVTCVLVIDLKDVHLPQTRWPDLSFWLLRFVIEFIEYCSMKLANMNLHSNLCRWQKIPVFRSCKTMPPLTSLCMILKLESYRDSGITLLFFCIETTISNITTKSTIGMFAHQCIITEYGAPNEHFIGILICTEWKNTLKTKLHQTLIVPNSISDLHFITEDEGKGFCKQEGLPVKWQCGVRGSQVWTNSCGRVAALW